MMKKWASVILLVFGLGSGPGWAQAPCAQIEAFHVLDFWVGTWTVVDASSGREVGTNRIEKVLDGCAVVEHWMSAQGNEGMSLFYYEMATATWKQVWVTQQATTRGGLKEKQLVERRDDGRLRFQGEVALPAGGTYLDRTTLIPRSDGRVRQIIERSTDGGRTWTVGFDAYYVQASAAGNR